MILFPSEYFNSLNLSSKIAKTTLDNDNRLSNHSPK